MLPLFAGDPLTVSTAVEGAASEKDVPVAVRPVGMALHEGELDNGLT